jgi:citrate lyase beta subunit
MDIAASRAQLRVFLRHRRATLARLRRVNEALSRWDEHDAAAAMPAALHSVVMLPPPSLARSRTP